MATEPSNRRSPHAGFTVLELVLTLFVLSGLLALLLPGLTLARRQVALSRCTANLRQLGMVYSMYAADFGAYPSPHRLVRGDYGHGPATLFCPAEPQTGRRRAASSYTFRGRLPESFRPYWELSDLPPATVLTSCRHHMGVARRVRGNSSEQARPVYPNRLVLRASGTVEPVRNDRLRLVPLPGAQGRFVNSYPGEPWHAKQEL